MVSEHDDGLKAFFVDEDFIPDVLLVEDPHTTLAAQRYGQTVIVIEVIEAAPCGGSLGDTARYGRLAGPVTAENNRRPLRLVGRGEEIEVCTRRKAPSANVDAFYVEYRISHEVSSLSATPQGSPPPHLPLLEHDAGSQAHGERDGKQRRDYSCGRDVGHVDEAQRNPVDLLVKQVYPEAVPLE